jgi:hypothetical protein
MERRSLKRKREEEEEEEQKKRESCAIYSPALLDEFIAIRDPGPSIASGVLPLGIRRPAGKVFRRGISMLMGRRGDLDFVPDRRRQELPCSGLSTTAIRGTPIHSSLVASYGWRGVRFPCLSRRRLGRAILAIPLPLLV